MGIRINTQVVYGLQISKKATGAFLKWREENNLTSDDAALMMLIEEIIEREKESEKKKHHSSLTSIAYTYAKVDQRKKTDRCFQPLRPFWDGFKKSHLKMMRGGDFDTYFKNCVEGHFKRVNTHKYHDDMILPSDNYEDDVQNFLGIRSGKRNYDRNVDWALLSVLDIPCEGGLIKCKGTRPWETGTVGNVCGKRKWWHTFNGRNMFPMPDSAIPEEFMILLNNFKGSRKEYIEKKKEAYYYVCPNEKAYYNHSNELWGWSAIDYVFADFVYETLSKWVPEIKYDYMRLGKYINFYWS